MLYVRADPERVPEADSLLGARPPTRRTPNRPQVSRPSDALQARADAQSTLTAVFLGLGAVALLVGGVGIANVMVISVLERRPEIGLRRALGARAVHIGVQFLGESVLLSLLGGCAGIALGAAATAGYASTPGLDRGRARAGRRRRRRDRAGARRARRPVPGRARRAARAGGGAAQRVTLAAAPYDHGRGQRATRSGAGVERSVGAERRRRVPARAPAVRRARARATSSASPRRPRSSSSSPGATIFSQGARADRAPARGPHAAPSRSCSTAACSTCSAPGELFGHASMLSGLPPGFAARAHEDTLCYRIPEAVARGGARATGERRLRRALAAARCTRGRSGGASPASAGARPRQPAGARRWSASAPVLCAAGHHDPRRGER